MKQINQVTTFTKTVFKFAFSLIALIINFLFFDTGNKQKEQDPLSSNQSYDPSLNWDDTHDDGWID